MLAFPIPLIGMDLHCTLSSDKKLFQNCQLTAVNMFASMNSDQIAGIIPLDAIINHIYYIQLTSKITICIHIQRIRETLLQECFE